MPQRRTPRSDLPSWIKPQLSKLVDKAPTGEQWVHEVKFDGSPHMGEYLFIGGT
jgi:ATP-dependent DNA ligase